MDFDSPTHETALIGPAVLRAAENRNSLLQPHLGYIVKSPDEYPDGEMQIRRAVYEQEHWAAISVARNATGKLEDALRSGDRSFDPDSLAEIVFVEGRDESVTRDCLPLFSLCFFLFPILLLLKTEEVDEYNITR